MKRLLIADWRLPIANAITVFCVSCVMAISFVQGPKSRAQSREATASARAGKNVGLGTLDAGLNGLIPPVPTNLQARVTRTNAPPRPVTVMTNIVLSWAAYTDAWFCVQASTNLTDWYFKTNVPICQTNVTVPVNQPQEFFRIKTCVNVWSN